MNRAKRGVVHDQAAVHAAFARATSDRPTRTHRQPGNDNQTSKGLRHALLGVGLVATLVAFVASITASNN